MFYILNIEEHIRVEPELFGLETKEAVLKQLENTYSSYVDKEIGSVIAILGVLDVGEGIIIPGDGAAYYKTNFKLLAFKPELQELVYGIVSDITNFGAIINIGVISGMIHISQAMDDYVNFSKTNTLIGKNSKRSLKKNDACLGRIVAISFKTVEPKIGLTMRQPGLGKLEWLQEDKKKTKYQAAKSVRQLGEGGKSKGKKKGGKRK